QSKLLKQCQFPLTGINCVHKIFTDLAIMDLLPEGGFRLLERAPGVSIEEIKEKTDGKLVVKGEIPEILLG
ncbi:MAG: succinyl-CoA--3-ketoacid-CoA transferase, partial [Cyclobacteriaceae bacterium]